mmetsp:Transcript_28821/g.88155  ORF Transcript_28821/g.88155 Transcript_28821/m.88155 type:complete len:149 (-) Transcript_28821:65-511(-)
MRTAHLVCLLQSGRAFLRASTSATIRVRRFGVSGVAWAEADTSAPVVQLFTKEGCTLCDEAKAVLEACRSAAPHTLELVDITEDPALWDAYKYDIPVLHVDGSYWAKHRLAPADAEAALLTAARLKAADQPFPTSPGRPDAARLEQKR